MSMSILTTFSLYCASVQISLELILFASRLTDVLFLTVCDNDEMMLTGRQHLSLYIDYDNYEARTTTTEADDDDDDDDDIAGRHDRLRQPSTSRLYEKPAATASPDVIDKVMECNQPTKRL